MADNQFSSTVEALFKGMDHFVTTKTVVGEAVKIDDLVEAIKIYVLSILEVDQILHS